MSHKETTDLIGHLDAGGAPNDSLPRLAEQARQAFEQKRTKDCLDLTRAILLIDPENSAAHSMRSSIQSEIHRDLENARAFLREAQPKQNQDKPSAPLPSPVEPDAAQGTPPQTTRFHLWKTFAESRWVSASALVALGVAAASFSQYLSKPNPVDAARIATSPNLSNAVERAKMGNPEPPLLPSDVVTLPSVSSLFAGREAAPVAVDPRLSRIEPPSPPVPSAPRTPPEIPEQAVIPRGNGTLAVSSPASVDIYIDGTYIGAAPVSLELSPGSQTLEYRHGALSRKVTHLINSNETTRATITFDVDIQVNSKPWAEVFLDGVERKALGQTPLSGVRIPIGSVLVFEHPGFPTKKYRVTGNETGIQNVFP
jgi:hypothetical protein